MALAFEECMTAMAGTVTEDERIDDQPFRHRWLVAQVEPQTFGAWPPLPSPRSPQCDQNAVEDLPMTLRIAYSKEAYNRILSYHRDRVH